MVIRFKDIIILSHLIKNPHVTGHRIVTYFHRKLGVLVSPATIYSTLYLLERHKLIEASDGQKRRTYRLTKKGESEIQKTKSSINSVLSSIFSETMELTK